MTKAVVNKVLDYMEGSIFFVAVSKSLDFLGKLFSSSVIIQSLGREQNKEKLQQCIFYQILIFVFGFLQKIGKGKFCTMIADSWLGKCIVNLPFLGIMGIIFLTPFLPTMVTAGIIIIVAMCFILKPILDRNFELSFDLMGYWILIFILITLFKGITSFAMASSMKIALLTTLFMLFYFLFTSVVDSVRKLEIVLFLFCTAALIVGLYGIYQQISGQVDTTWVDRSLFQDVKMRIYSTFDNPNVYGEYLLVALPISLLSTVMFKNIFLRLYCLGISALLLINLGLTYSRGCYLALALAVFVFIMFIEKRAIVLFSAGIFALPFILPENMLNRIFSITNLSDSSTSYRIMIWIGSIRILKDFWTSGIGQGIDAYNTVYPLYSFNAIAAPHSHNLFLQTFVETGIIGIIAFLAIIFCFFKTLAPFFYKSKTMAQKIFAAGLMALMSGFLLQSLFDYSFYNYKVYLTFFTTLAIASVYVRLESKNLQASGVEK